MHNVNARSISGFPLIPLQVRLYNCTVSDNTASSGGGAALWGPGTTLALQGGTSLSGNTAAPSSSPSAGDLSAAADTTSAGGGVYAQGCMALLLGEGSSIASCKVSGVPLEGCREGCPSGIRLVLSHLIPHCLPYSSRL